MVAGDPCIGSKRERSWQQGINLEQTMFKPWPIVKPGAETPGKRIKILSDTTLEQNTQDAIIRNHKTKKDGTFVPTTHHVLIEPGNSLILEEDHREANQNQLDSIKEQDHILQQDEEYLSGWYDEDIDQTMFEIAESFQTTQQPSLLDPPKSSNPASQEDSFETQDLVDDGIDWEDAFTHVERTQALFSSDQSSPSNLTQTTSSLMVPIFTRPPFPPTILDCSPIMGLSSSTLLRTCFGTEKLLVAHISCASYSKDYMIELFARVFYSTREIGSRTQHFHFFDLWKDCPPHPRGTLTNWRHESLMDKQSKSFLRLTRTSPKYCRCLCKVEKNRNSMIGWTLDIKFIRETSWDEIDFVRHVVYRDG